MKTKRRSEMGARSQKQQEAQLSQTDRSAGLIPTFIIVLSLYINCFLTETAAVIPVNCENAALEREGLLSPQNLR